MGVVIRVLLLEASLQFIEDIVFIGAETDARIETPAIAQVIPPVDVLVGIEVVDGKRVFQDRRVDIGIAESRLVTADIAVVFDHTAAFLF